MRNGEADYPVHVGIYIGTATTTSCPPKLEVTGLPRLPGRGSLGVSVWGADEVGYQVDFIGARETDPAKLAKVAYLATRLSAEFSQLSLSLPNGPDGRARGCVLWAETAVIDSGVLVAGIPMFVEGTCAHYVEYLYEHAGLDLVDQNALVDRAQPNRLNPTLQMRAFHRDQYPLPGPWQPHYSDWLTCLTP